MRCPSCNSNKPEKIEWSYKAQAFDARQCLKCGTFWKGDLYSDREMEILNEPQNVPSV